MWQRPTPRPGRFDDREVRDALALATVAGALGFPPLLLASSRQDWLVSQSLTGRRSPLGAGVWARLGLPASGEGRVLERVDDLGAAVYESRGVEPEAL